MSDSDLTINVESMKRVDYVTVAGRVDSNTSPQLDEALKRVIGDGRHNIAIDLRDVSYLSSAGLRAIVSALRECKKKRGNVVIVSPSERVAEVLSLAGLQSLFEVYDDSVKAVGSF